MPNFSMRLRSVARVMPEQFRGVDLVVVRFLERLDDQFAFDGGNDLQFRIALGPLKQLPRQRGGIGRGRIAGRAGDRRQDALPEP